jgi:hypothetical protein
MVLLRHQRSGEGVGVRARALAPPAHPGSEELLATAEAAGQPSQHDAPEPSLSPAADTTETAS